MLGCGDSSTAPPSGDVARLILSPETAAVPVGESRPLTLSFQDAAGAELPPVAGVFWSSSNSEVATVTQEGVVTAVALGESQVAASLAGTSATARISVVPQPVATVQVSPATVSLRVAQTATLSAVTLSAGNASLTGRAITWSTTNADVAGVSDAGVVTAVAPGTARITATSEGVSGGADVTVSPATLASITVTPNRPTVGVGQGVVLAAVLVDELGAPVTGRSVTWSTSDAGIASVGADGRVTGVKPGAATISAGLDGVVGSATVTVTAGPVSQVTISPATASVTVAQAVTLTATLRDAGGNVVTGQPVSWRSNASGVATITSGGVARGVSPGTAIITATVGSNSGSAVITVTAVPVASIGVAPSPATVRVGETVKLDATPRAADGSALTGRVVQWSSSNESRAIVSSSGLVRGVSPGGVTITARSEGKSGTSAVTVTAAAVATVAVSPATLGLAIGQTDRLTATVRDASGNPLESRTVSWTTSDAAIATVDAAGVVTARAAGTATITAASEGKSGSARVTVTSAPVATVVVSPATAALLVGQTRALAAELRDARDNVLTGRTVEWATSDAAVATVDGAGVVTAVAPGAATITARSEGKSGTAAITVSATPVASVEVTPATASVRLGATTTLAATPRDGGGNALTGRVVVWSSSDDGVATVSSAGVVTGRTLGTVTITATSEGKSGSATVTVLPVAVASVVVSPSAATLVVGELQTLTAEARDAGGTVLTGRSVEWTSSDAAVATVNAGGVVRGVALGTATITATIEGVAGSAAVTVNPPPPVVASVTIDPPKADLDVGQTVRLTATPRSKEGEVVTGRIVVWESGDPAVATVDATGLVTAVGPGRADIRATVDGVDQTAAISVRALEPSRIERVSGDGQTGAPDRALPAPLVVRVVNPRGEPFADVRVKGDLRSKDGRLTPDETRTGDDGVASFSWRMPAGGARDGKKVKLALLLPDFPSVAPAEFEATVRDDGEAGGDAAVNPVRS